MITEQERKEREDRYVEDTPEWAKVPTPAKYQKYVGRAGLKSQHWNDFPRTLGGQCQGIDRWHGNEFIVYREETADFLDREYSPTEVSVPAGTMPLFEEVVARYTKPGESAVEKADAFITKFMRAELLHPSMPPAGPPVDAGRQFTDDQLLVSGCAWCNEQARVFVRLCQVAGIPARMIFLFYADDKSGHTTAEFWTGESWAFVDVTSCILIYDENGRPFSTREIHYTEKGRKCAGEAYYARMQDLMSLSDEGLCGRAYPANAADRAKLIADRAAKIRVNFGDRWTPEYCRDHLKQFGVYNYPLPS